MGARRRAADFDGVNLEAARRRPHRRALLVGCFGCGRGRWSDETRSFRAVATSMFVRGVDAIGRHCGRGHPFCSDRVRRVHSTVRQFFFKFPRKKCSPNSQVNQPNPFGQIVTLFPSNVLNLDFF